MILGDGRPGSIESDPGEPVIFTGVSSNGGIGIFLTTDTCQLVAKAGVADQSRFSQLLAPNSGHVVVSAKVFLHDGFCVRTRSNSNSSPAVVMTMIIGNRRVTVFTDTDPGPNVMVTMIVLNRPRCLRKSNSCVVVFEAMIVGHGWVGTSHDAHTTSHVPVANVFRDQRLYLSALGAGNRNACVANMMHDVISHLATDIDVDS